VNLIFNADDFGSHPSISRGIIQAIEHGVVRSTTVMANLVDDASLAALAALPQVSVGVHLNLTKGRPLTAFPPDCLENGWFSRAKLFQPDGAPLLPEYAIRTELEAQVQKLVEAGLKLTHLDSHHNIHAFVNVLHVADCRRARAGDAHPFSRYVGLPGLEGGAPSCAADNTLFWEE